MVDGMDRNSIIQTVNNALLVYEAQKNGAPAAADTPLKRLEASAARILTDFQALILTIDENQRRWIASDVTELIMKTNDGEVVPGGTYDKHRWMELAGAYTALAVWLQTPLSDGGPTPGKVIFRDYVAPTHKQE